jgi:uncharacterized membrane protein
MSDDTGTVTDGDRVQGFSDAIYAITITLLVLEIPRPDLNTTDLGHRLLEQWPDYLAFAVSFIYIGVLWLNHHALFDRVRRVDLGMRWINLGILGTTALLPFSTAVLAGAYGAHAPLENREAAVVLYAGINLSMSAAWVPVFGHLRRHPELLEDPNESSLVAAQRSRPWVGVISYAIAALLGYLVHPTLALVLFVWMIAYHAITSDGLHSNRVALRMAPGKLRNART